ncbi:MAG: hypothetical protein JJU13_04735 [Balneolaceae bacterium]|nr:hypothetical protein [Balneolaceae bacterium]
MKRFILLAGFFLVASLAYSQSGHNHDHNHDHPHDHSHSHTHPHTHVPVDYSFRSDAGHYTPPVPDEDGYIWWKGNLHTHTLWSDGDQFPEVVTEWYYEHGYHFLALSDHNTLLQGQRWINPEENHFVERGGGSVVYEIYQERFGDDWIDTRLDEDGNLEVRLKPLQEVRSLFEQSGRFLMIDSEEITEGQHVIHVNATNILEYIAPQTGETVEETIRLNMDAVIDQRERTGQEMLPHLNHPNFRHAVTAEDMMPVENLRLFEIYNGHRGVVNFGADDGIKHLDRVWDIILTKRLGELGLDPVYGIAVDDAHHYEESTSDVARPGRGWVKVRSKFLTPENIVKSLESGNFYSTNGLTMTNITSDGQTYSVEVEPEYGIEYTIQFIGTREGYDSSSSPYVDDEGEERSDRTRLYSSDIGEVLQETEGHKATYEFQGDELYVRAKLTSTKPKENYFYEGEVKKAWMQPVIPGYSYGEMIQN